MFVSKQSNPTSKSSKKFGEGMFNDSNAYDWWKPGDGGL